MPHMTLNIPKDLHERMKEHPEIKWTEVARRRFEEYLADLDDRIDSNELKKRLNKEAVEIIKSLNDEETKRMHGEAVRLEWERMRSSTQTS